MVAGVEGGGGGGELEQNVERTTSPSLPGAIVARSLSDGRRIYLARDNRSGWK